MGLDPIVLVRCIVQDDPGQANAAARLMEDGRTAPLLRYVSVPVLVQPARMLAAPNRYESGVVAAVIRQPLRTIELQVEDRDAAWSALQEFEAGAADFADWLIALRNRARGCTQTFTLDRAAARGRHFAPVP